MIKVSELKGLKSLKALNVFHTLLFGLKMHPLYMTEKYETFLERVHGLDAKDQEALFREAMLFVELQDDEIYTLARFCKDPNGVPYSKENVDSLGPNALIDLVVAVCMEVARLRVGILSDLEKKKSMTSQ